jgi:NAD(P)-dependent dehydrogenase (short-subunit alcohol dehydrogenase family)
MSQSIMIIGAGPGIGQSVAKRFGAAGWHVILAARSVSRIEQLAVGLRAKGITASSVQLDATDPDALRAAMGSASDLSVVHFNAAVVRQQDLFNMTDAEVTDDLAINVAGGLHTIRAAVDRFGTGGGTILITGGGLGVTPHASYASLGVGKAALRNIVQALAEPLAERNIRIATATVATLVGPGSPEAVGVADTLWDLATNPAAAWEAVYPANTI